MERETNRKASEDEGSRQRSPRKHGPEHSLRNQWHPRVTPNGRGTQSDKGREKSNRVGMHVMLFELGVE